ncbi:hypothetical protein HMPREF1869_00765 [Bacteroidales bacterium KA00251]|nr:hypothetical protein HMPREF1869_00765 [Bacteroidales bacterium KA00251]
MRNRSHCCKEGKNSNIFILKFRLFDLKVSEDLQKSLGRLTEKSRKILMENSVVFYN